MKSCYLAFGKIVITMFVEFYWYGVYYCFPQHSEWVMFTSGGFFLKKRKKSSFMYFSLFLPFYFLCHSTQNLSCLLGNFTVYVTVWFVHVIHFCSCLWFIFLPPTIFCLSNWVHCPVNSVICASEFVSSFKCSCNSHLFTVNLVLVVFLTHITHFVSRYFNIFNHQ